MSLLTYGKNNMIRELEKIQQTSQFPETAPDAYPLFFRTDSRRTEEGQETWGEVCDRTTYELAKFAILSSDQQDLNKLQKSPAQ